jgi:hypothetical protein
MSAPTTDAVSAYLAVLRGVGLNESEIRRLHGPSTSGSDPLDRAISEAVEATTEEEWHDLLVGTLCRSPQGLDLPRFYKSQAAADAIAAMAAAHGYEATVEPKQGREFALELTDELTGETDHVMIGYPKTELGADNLPALLAAIEQVRLAADGLTVALLSTTERWQAILIEQSALEGLQEQFGERIEPFDQPVLADATPVDFVVDPPIPGQAPEQRLEDPSDVDLETWLENATVESTEEVIEALEESGTKRVVAENKSDDVLESIEEPIEPPEHEPVATETTDSDITETGTVKRPDEQSASEQEVDPDEITLPETDRDASSSTDETDEGDSPTSIHATGGLPAEELTIEDARESSGEQTDEGPSSEDLSEIGGGPTKTVSTDGIDEVFEKLEKQALDPEDLARPVSRSDTEPPTLDSAFSDDDIDEEFGTLSGGGPKRSVSSTSADDILSSAGDGDFDSFSDDESTDHVETDPESLLDADSDMEREDENAGAGDGLEPKSEEMDDFVGDELVGEGATSTRSTSAAEDDGSGSLEEIEGLADRVAERLSGSSSSEPSKDRDWTEATDGGRSGGNQTASVGETPTSDPESTQSPETTDASDDEGDSEEPGLEQFRFPGREGNDDSRRETDDGFAIPEGEFDIESEKPTEAADQSDSSDEE